MMTCTPLIPRRGRLAAALALGLLVPAAPAAAGTIAPPAPPSGDATVVAAKAKPGARPAVARAPRDVVVLGAVHRTGSAAFAVVRPRRAAAGATRLRVRGAARITARAAAVLTSSRTLPAAACAPRGPSSGLRRVLRRGRLSAADAKALGAALERRACGRAPEAGDAALLRRLGLRAPSTGVGSPSAPAGGAGGALSGPAPGAGATTAPATRPGGRTPPPPGDTGTFGACKDGRDNDGDGQVDARGEGANPDPGCMNGNDATEDSERPASAACAAVSGVSMNTGNRREAFAAVNRDCGDAIEITVTVAPGVVVCDVMTAVTGYVCVIDQGAGHVFNRLMNGPATDVFDIPLTLTADVDCAKPATIAIARPDLTVEEIVEPVEPCAGGGGTPPPAECANGRDDDGDGQVDARDQPGASDPDPGCAGPADTSEGSEIAAPAGCAIQAGVFGGDPRRTGFIADGCGTLTGAWFRPPGTPASCVFLLDGAQADCAVSGAVGVAAFAGAAGELRMVTPITADADCRPVTVALRRADGQVIEVREAWC